MKFAGGYLDYLALLDDARAYDDVTAFMAGTVDAEKVAKLMAQVRDASNGE